MAGEAFVTKWISEMSDRELLRLRELIKKSNYQNNNDAILPKEAIDLMVYLINKKLGDE